MSSQIAFSRGNIVTLVAFVSGFPLDLPIFQTKVIIFKSVFHCQCVLCFPQMVVSNWVKSMIAFGQYSQVLTFPWHTFTFSLLSGRYLGDKCPKIRATDVPKSLEQNPKNFYTSIGSKLLCHDPSQTQICAPPVAPTNIPLSIQCIALVTGDL